MEEDGDFGYKQITIIGVGLIGGSLGLALKKKKPAFKIIGVDKQDILDKAIIRGAIDKGANNLKAGVQEADIIFLAAPVKDILELITQINPFLKKGCLVTDTGSTKVKIVHKANQKLSKDIFFIGGHPMAGSEQGGIENAHAGLFTGKSYIVIPGNKNSHSAKHRLSSIIKYIGAVELEMKAADHDRVVALISHMPQLIAVIMMNMLGSLIEKDHNEQYYRVGGNVFYEMTRAANSPFPIWKDIYRTNRADTINVIEELEFWLESMKYKIKKNPARLEDDFEKAKSFKEKMFHMMNKY